MTPEVFRKLADEIARMTDGLRAADAAARRDGVSGDRAAPVVVAAGEFHVLARRLDACERLLEAAEVVEPDGRAVLGARVTLRFADGELEAFELVAPGEVDPASGRVSHESPLGAAVMGRRAGETVSVAAPAGPQELTVVEVA
jgi:transcription elongation factor GreA